jgi:hypothetical protein
LKSHGMIRKRQFPEEIDKNVFCLFNSYPQPKCNHAVRNTARNLNSMPATRAQPCCAEYRPQPEHNCAVRNTARNLSATVPW